MNIEQTNQQKRPKLKQVQNKYNIIDPSSNEQILNNQKILQLKPSTSQGYKRLSFYSKQKTQIPNLKQAKNRQKHIKYFHNRNFYKRKHNLEEIFKQNMRLYQQINTQKSHYFQNFKRQKSNKKSKKSHSVSCTQYHTTKYIDLQKASRDQNFENNKSVLERRFSFSVGRTYKKDTDKNNEQKQNSINKVESDFSINLKRYEKNKTQMIPRRNKIIIDMPSQHSSFLEGDKNDKIFTPSKNPAYLRFKKRPNSGYRC